MGGSNVQIILTDRPTFAFLPDFDERNIKSDEEANRALLVQLCVESGLAKASNLAWSPDLGVAATEARWTSNVRYVEGRAIFRWPWLVRPTASQVLNLGAVTKRLSGAVTGNSLRDLGKEILLAWLSTNIEWWHAQGAGRGEVTELPAPIEYASFDLAAAALKNIREGEERSKESEVIRWVGELSVMTAPYFGLPEPVATAMREAFITSDLMPSNTDIAEEQERMIDNAIILGQGNVAQIGHRALPAENILSSPDYDKAVKDFLEKQKERSKGDKWWDWVSREAQGDST